MATSGELAILITGKNTASKAFDDASKSAGGLGKALTDVGKIAAGFLAGGAIASGVTKLTGFLGDSASAFKESRMASAQLDAVLKSTKGAIGLTADQLKGMASALEKTSVFEDEAIIGAQSLLLTFTQIGKGVLPDATQTVLDMSQALGQDLKSSSIQLGKALNDPLKGITALSRVGVSFTEQQKKQIEAMVKAGDIAGAQKLILAELNTEFGGSAKAASDAAGASERMKDRMNDLREEIGEKLLPIQEKWQQAQLAAVNFIASNALPAIQKLADWVGPRLSEAWQMAQPYIAKVQAFLQSSVIPVLQDQIPVALQKVGAFVQTEFAKFRTYYESDVKPALENIRTAAEAVVSWVVNNWPKISAVISPVLAEIQNRVQLAVAVISTALGVIVDLIGGDFSGAWTRIKELVATVWSSIQTSVANALELLKQLAPVAQQVGDILMNALWDGLLAVWDQIKVWLPKIPGAMVEALKDLGAEMFKVGKQAGSQLWEGFKDGAKSLPGAALDAIGGLLPSVPTPPMFRVPDGSHAGGLNYVPFDGYRAILHRGERVLTASEARGGSSGGGSSGTLQPIILQVNGREWGRVMVDLKSGGAFRGTFA